MAFAGFVAASLAAAQPSGPSTSTSALASAGAAAAVSFDREIAPILAARCVGCHRPDKTKGGYQLHTQAALLKPGRSGDRPVVAGHPESSALVRMVESTDSDERMPQDGEPLSAAEVRLIRRWIKDGAPPGLQSLDTPLTALAASAVPQPSAPEHYPHPVAIHALAFSPDGQSLAAGGYHEVCVWNPADGSLRRRIGNVARQVQQMAFSPDGSTLAIAAGTPGRLGEVKLFDAATGQWLRTLAAVGDLMTTVAFSPDGKQLAAGGSDNAIAVFDRTSGSRLFRAELNADWVMHVAFSPDGGRLVVGSRDKTVRIVSVAAGELEATYAGHTDPVFAAEFAEGGTRVISAGRDRAIHGWQASDGKKLAESPALSASVARLVRSGDRLFSGLSNGEIVEHRVESKKISAARVLGRHADGVGAMAVHEKSKRLASAGYNGRIQIWDLTKGELTNAFRALP